KIPLSCDAAVIDLIASRCTEVESGGRMVDAILTQTLLPEISRQLLNCLLDGKPAAKVNVGVKDGEFVYEF
ncbi:MAG: hypothetical protein WCC08_13245, partial [Terrimicrobiaceae bacterium]